MLDEFIHEPRVAYFSMEIALRNEIPTYAGGLGILAGDTLRSATDLDLPLVRDLCSFTTHTPVESGHDRFPYDLAQRVLDNGFDAETVKRLAGEESLNMTRLALNLSEYVNSHRMMRRYATEAYAR